MSRSLVLLGVLLDVLLLRVVPLLLFRELRGKGLNPRAGGADVRGRRLWGGEGEHDGVDGGEEGDATAECLVAPLLPARRDRAARAQTRGGVVPLRISSRMASLPASKAPMRRCVCSSNSSRLLSSHSPARPCASLAISCALRATSPPRSAMSSRVSRPAFGASRRAA